uniref:Uncharacterized protein n=1 Tax=viral metagenome TaxID=1070528 RepID=A0A6M3KXX7_9ZZZZ
MLTIKEIKMPIKQIKCPSCGHKYNLPTKEAENGFIKCPKCHYEKPVIWAEFSTTLVFFDNALCRKAATMYDEGDKTQGHAKLCILLLEEVASLVSHILKEKDGNLGDMVRGFEKHGKSCEIVEGP